MTVAIVAAVLFVL